MFNARSVFGSKSSAANVAAEEIQPRKMPNADGEGFPAYRTVRRQCHFDSAAIREVANTLLGNTPDAEAQREFLDAFLEEVVDRTLDVNAGIERLLPTEEGVDTDERPFHPRNLLLVSTDGSRLEIRVSPREAVPVGGRVRAQTSGKMGVVVQVDHGQYRISFDDDNAEWLKQVDFEVQEKSAVVDLVAQLAEEFLKQLGMPEDEGMFTTALDYISCAKDSCNSLAEDIEPDFKPTDAELWCVLENIGTERACADAGFSLWWTQARQPLKWCAVDALLPASEDKETFFEFAMAEKPPLMPMCYTCSFMTAIEEPAVGDSVRAAGVGGTRTGKVAKVTGSELPYEVKFEDGQVPNSDWYKKGDVTKQVETEVPTSIRGLQLELPRSPQAAFLGLMVFKAMGFAKPNDDVFKTLLDLEQRGAYVGISLGRQGLSRLFIRFYRTLEFQDKVLADTMGFEYKQDTLQTICRALKATQSEIIEYAAEPRGLTISVGYAG